jgi:hypothetical protein
MNDQLFEKDLDHRQLLLIVIRTSTDMNSLENEETEYLSYHINTKICILWSPLLSQSLSCGMFFRPFLISYILSLSKNFWIRTTLDDMPNTKIISIYQSMFHPSLMKDILKFFLLFHQNLKVHIIQTFQFIGKHIFVITSVFFSYRKTVFPTDIT